MGPTLTPPPPFSTSVYVSYYKDPVNPFIDTKGSLEQDKNISGYESYGNVTLNRYVIPKCCRSKKGKIFAVFFFHVIEVLAVVANIDAMLFTGRERV